MRAGKRLQGRSEETVSGGRFLLFWIMCLLIFLVWRGDFVPPFDLPFHVSALASGSMQPEYRVGGLAIITPAESIEVGDVIAFRVPVSAQQTHGLPPRLMHRVVEYDVAGGRLQTKGDANGAPDPFVVDVVWVLGKPRFYVPFLGYLFLFLWSQFGKTWLGFVALAAIYPWLADHLDRIVRRFTRLLDWADSSPAAHAGQQGQQAPAIAAVTLPIADRLDTVYREVLAARSSLQHWEAAMGEYAMHLKTHTAVLKHLDEATRQLSVATAALAGETRRSAPVREIPGTTSAAVATWSEGRTVLEAQLVQKYQEKAMPPGGEIVTLPDADWKIKSEPLLGNWFRWR